MAKYYKSKKTFSLLTLAVLLFGLVPVGNAQHEHNHSTIKSADVPLDRIKNDCRFFSGDTLNGFALEATIETGIKKLSITLQNFHGKLMKTIILKELMSIPELLMLPVIM